MTHYTLPILAVISGFIFVLIFKPKHQKNLRLLLGFSGAFLLSLTVFSLLPAIYSAGASKTVGIYIMFGILLQIFLEFFSRGAEHGHVHLDKQQRSFPWVLFVSLSIHAFLEGFPIHEHRYLVYGIFIHKLPVAIILSTFLISTDIKKRDVLIFLILFALMTPFGTLLAASSVFIQSYSDQLSGIIIGIFLHISTIILFESSEGHKFNIRKLIGIAIGMASAYLIS